MTLFKQDRDFSKHEPAGVPAAYIEMQLVLRTMARAEGPQGHGVAQHIHRSDAVVPASLCSWQPSRDRRRNRFVAPLRSRTAQCASLIAPYTSLAARRIVSPTAQAP